MRNKSILFVRYSLLAVAVALIATVLFQREHLAVMQKAVKICLECIGIG